MLSRVTTGSSRFWNCKPCATTVKGNKRFRSRVPWIVTRMRVPFDAAVSISGFHAFRSNVAA
jgi:hypothetical protein